MLKQKISIGKQQKYVFITDEAVARDETDIYEWFTNGTVSLKPEHTPSYIHVRPLSSHILTKCRGLVNLDNETAQLSWERITAADDFLLQLARHCVVKIDGVDLEYTLSGTKILSQNCVEALCEISEMISLDGKNVLVSLPGWIGLLLQQSFFRSRNREGGD